MTDPDSNTRSAVGTSSYYDELWARAGDTLEYTEVDRAHFIVESLQSIPNHGKLRILDLGCGRGWLAPFLSPSGQVTGIDFSQVGIEFARKNYGEHAEFVIACPDSPTLGLAPDSEYDVVISSEVIEHVPDPLDYLGQVHRMLSSKGWCVLTTPNGNVWTQFSADPTYKRDLQPIENWVSPQQLIGLFRKAGFTVKRHEARPAYEFRVGLTGRLQNRRIERIFKKLGLSRFYYRLILPSALYQMATARKIG